MNWYKRAWKDNIPGGMADKKKPSDYQAAMKIVRDKDLTSKNAPGGLFKKGGSVKKKKKFPDLSGDGKVTKKDILMAKGIIKKKPKKKR